MNLLKERKDIVLKLNKEGRKLRKDYSELIKVDLGLEVMFQLAGQVNLKSLLQFYRYQDM